MLDIVWPNEEGAVFCRAELILLRILRDEETAVGAEQSADTHAGFLGEAAGGRLSGAQVDRRDRRRVGGDHVRNHIYERAAEGGYNRYTVRRQSPAVWH